MNRRELCLAPLALGAAAMAKPLVRPLPSPSRTRWRIGWSEGLDAIASLGALSGAEFYARYYPEEVAAFQPRLSPSSASALAAVEAEYAAAGSLLWPNLALILSGGRINTLDEVIASLEAMEASLEAAFRASPYWDESDWSLFAHNRDRLAGVMRSLRDAEFGTYWRGLMEEAAASRARTLQQLFDGADVVSEQERLVGRSVNPEIRVELSWFCRPHGVKLQGQRFVIHVRARDEIAILTAAHELLHPPLDMEGPAARAALAVLAVDPLFTRILTEKDPSTGYNTLSGLLNEDLVQALDQIVQERLGMAARAPAERWLTSDQGIHVLAAGVYGLMKSDGYDREGGVLEDWVLQAAGSGRLAPASLHAAAGAVLGRSPDALWPVAN